MARPPIGTTEDLASLGDLTEEILLAELKHRYAQDNIYVRIARWHSAHTIYCMYGNYEE